MRRHYGWWSLAILCGLIGTVHAGDPAPPSNRPAAGFQGTTPVPAKPAAPNSKPVSTKSASRAPTFADRMKAAQQVQDQQRQADENRPKPTNWQMQNPSNPTNHTPTSMNGTVATNNYFGNQFRDWNRLSQPAPMTQLPFNQTAVPAINQTSLYTAPNTYFGTQNSGWSNLQSPQPEMNPVGGWRYR